jgi:hypothetical protein
MRQFHVDGTLPTGRAVFVFGSNLAGMHGGGAARAAADKFGAEFGVGIGLTGSSYAIPTKDERIQTMPLAAIEPHVEEFLRYASARSAATFFVTRIGCGLAGYSDGDIAPMFKNAPLNCNLPEAWRPWVEGDPS